MISDWITLISWWIDDGTVFWFHICSIWKLCSLWYCRFLEFRFSCCVIDLRIFRRHFRLSIGNGNLGKSAGCSCICFKDLRCKYKVIWFWCLGCHYASFWFVGWCGWWGLGLGVNCWGCEMVHKSSSQLIMCYADGFDSQKWYYP